MQFEEKRSTGRCHGAKSGAQEEKVEEKLNGIRERFNPANLPAYDEKF